MSANLTSVVNENDVEKCLLVHLKFCWIYFENERERKTFIFHSHCIFQLARSDAIENYWLVENTNYQPINYLRLSKSLKWNIFGKVVKWKINSINMCSTSIDETIILLCLCAWTCGQQLKLFRKIAGLTNKLHI